MQGKASCVTDLAVSNMCSTFAAHAAAASSSHSNACHSITIKMRSIKTKERHKSSSAPQQPPASGLPAEEGIGFGDLARARLQGLPERGDRIDHSLQGAAQGCRGSACVRGMQIRDACSRCPSASQAQYPNLPSLPNRAPPPAGAHPVGRQPLLLQAEDLRGVAPVHQPACQGAGEQGWSRRHRGQAGLQAHGCHSVRSFAGDSSASFFPWPSCQPLPWQLTRSAPTRACARGPSRRLAC